jgi:hypothetical protein
MGEFWIPKFKWQLVDWFVGRWMLTRVKAERMTKRQLMGKYCQVRREGVGSYVYGKALL